MPGRSAPAGSIGARRGRRYARTMPLPAADPLVQTRAGAVRGRWRGGSAAFLGIPFAQPPVGPLRLGAPVPAEPWEGVRDASAYGATAHRGEPGATLIPEPTVPGDATLNVNVFTPAPGDADARLPVLVYIHGGGFVAGSPASPWYDGRAFNRDGIVTVTISYRLGFDGFGWIEDGVNNRAVRDWLLALEWVRENISGFGGDPRRVTIAGQSAGGAAVLTLLAVPAARGLFHRAWAMSAPVSGTRMDAARRREKALAVAAGVEPTRAGFASVSEERLLELQQGLSADRQNRLAEVRDLLADGAPWGPVIDGDLLPHPPLEALASGAGADVPLVIGATDDEFTMITDGATRALRWAPASAVLALLGLPRRPRRAYLSANGPQRAKGTAAVVGRFVTDRIFRTTVLRVRTARGAAPTWVYRFAWPSPVRRWALHCLDVPFFFDCLDDPAVAALAGDAPPRSLADAIHGAAVAFVTGGDPGWPMGTDDAATTRVFDAPDPGIQSDAFASARALL
jgi:para-nitrobenzyl esterase